MRTKNGKRIGPVPIALVAVFALAAFVSVGIWLAPNSAQAQGIPTAPQAEAQIAGTGDDDCKVVVINADGMLIGGPVEGGGCSVSGDSVDVALENAHNMSYAVAVYTTGGDEYNVQAMDYTPTVPLGKKGVNEDLFEIDARASKVGGGTSPGSQTVTVSRDMADDKGEVYLFVYHATSDMIYAFNYEHIASDDNPAAGLNNGIPFSLISGKTSGDPAGYNDTTIDVLDTVELAVVAAVNAALLAAEADPALDGGVMLLPRSQTLSAPTNVPGKTTAETMTLKDAKAFIVDITGDLKYTTPGATSGVPNTVDTLKTLVSTANAAIAEFENVIGVVDGTTGSVNSFYGSQADISVRVVFRDLATKGTDDNGDGSIKGEEERSTLKVELTPSKTTGEATVIAVIKDTNGTLLAGFVDLTVEGDADVLFKDSSLKTHRVELGAAEKAPDGSTGPVIVKGLSKTDPVRVKVTASYNGGELIQEVYLSRLGDATEVEATAYACVENDKDITVATDDALDGDACDYEIMALTGDRISSNDPKELVSIGADDAFFIAGTAKDALGSTIDSLSSGNVTWKATDAAAREAFVQADGNTNTQIMIASDAEPGTYNITVEDSGKDASATIMVVVAGDASMISVSCDPMMIPTDTGLTDCTVAVTDAGGNIASNLDTTVTANSPERNQVQVSVRGSSDIKADLIGAKDNLVNLDENGMANFAIQMPLDAVEGTQITVNVSTTIDDELLRNHTVVTYGGPSTDPGTTDPGTMDELTAPMNVEAGYVPLTGSISMSWTPGQSASRQMVVVLDSNLGVEYFQTVPATDTVHDITMELEAGDYTVYVLSIAGSDFKYGSDSVMVPSS